MSRLRLFVYGGCALLILLAGVYFVSIFYDPIINYYGVRMRESQLVELLMTQTPTNPNFGMYCYARPLHDLHEQSICFDTQAELDQYLDRRHEVERQLGRR